MQLPTGFHALVVGCLLVFAAVDAFQQPPRKTGTNIIQPKSSARAVGAGPLLATKKQGAAEQKKTWQEKLDDALWDFIYGAREKQWNPDRRPEGERGAFDRTASTLSWGRWPLELEGAEGAMAAAAQAEAEYNGGAAQEEEGEEESPYAAPAFLTESPDKNDPLRRVLDEQAKIMADLQQVPTAKHLRRFASGRELAELCFAKYGQYHDLSVYYSDPFGKDQRQVAFNVYGSMLGARNFPMTEFQYLAKLDYVVEMLNAWDQAWYVKAFLLEPPIARRGLPSHPKWDTAVTLRLNKSPTWKYLDLERIKEFIAKDN